MPNEKIVGILEESRSALRKLQSEMLSININLQPVKRQTVLDWTSAIEEVIKGLVPSKGDVEESEGEPTESSTEEENQEQESEEQEDSEDLEQPSGEISESDRSRGHRVRKEKERRQRR